VELMCKKQGHSKDPDTWYFFKGTSDPGKTVKDDATGMQKITDSPCTPDTTDKTKCTIIAGLTEADNGFIMCDVDKVKGKMLDSEPVPINFGIKPTITSKFEIGPSDKFKDANKIEDRKLTCKQTVAGGPDPGAWYYFKGETDPGHDIKADDTGMKKIEDGKPCKPSDDAMTCELIPDLKEDHNGFFMCDVALNEGQKLVSKPVQIMFKAKEVKGTSALTNGYVIGPAGKLETANSIADKKLTCKNEGNAAAPTAWYYFKGETSPGKMVKDDDTGMKKITGDTPCTPAGDFLTCAIKDGLTATDNGWVMCDVEKNDGEELTTPPQLVKFITASAPVDPPGITQGDTQETNTDATGVDPNPPNGDNGVDAVRISFFSTALCLTIYWMFAV